MPGAHSEHAVQLTTLVVVLKFAPATHAAHTVSEVVVHTAVRCVPGWHTVQLEHAGALDVVVYVAPDTHAVHTVLAEGTHSAER